MMSGWMSRSQWAGSAQSPAQAVMSGTPAGVAVHWVGPGAWLARGNQNPAGLMRDIRSWHTPQGKADFAYSLAVNGAGLVIEGRNTPQRPRVRPGSNGSNRTNNSHYSIVLLTGQGDPAPGPAMIAAAGRAVAWLRQHGGAGPAVVGHRDLHPTSCPGDQIQSLLPRIAAAAGGQTGDDDMTPEQAAQLAESHWMLSQLRGTDIPPVHNNTSRVVRPIDNTYWLVANALIPAVKTLSEQVAELQRDRGLPVTPMTLPEPPGDQA